MRYNPPRRQSGPLVSALDGFLGTMTSRNSDHEGYWVWGQVESRLDGLDVDLLGTPPPDDDAFSTAVRMACQDLRDQVRKAGLDFGLVSQARLQVAFEGGLQIDRINGVAVEGHIARFVALAALDACEVTTRETRVFVAPHDVGRERRSGRASLQGIADQSAAPAVDLSLLRPEMGRRLEPGCRRWRSRTALDES